MSSDWSNLSRLPRPSPARTLAALLLVAGIAAAAAAITTLERLEGGSPDDETLRRLAALPKLADLSVSGGAATDAGVAALAGSTSLKRVRFSGGKGITAEGLDALRRQAPQMTIVGP